MTADATQISLAPAAGAGIGRQMFAELLARPNFAAELAQAAVDGLNAMTPPRWDPAAQDWTSSPDYRVRTTTLFALLAQAEGAPIKRSVQQVITGPVSTDDIERQLEANPAARAAMLKLIQDADYKAKHGKRRPVRLEKPAEVMDVD